MGGYCKNKSQPIYWQAELCVLVDIPRVLPSHPFSHSYGEKDPVFRDPFVCVRVVCVVCINSAVSSHQNSLVCYI